MTEPDSRTVQAAPKISSPVKIAAKAGYSQYRLLWRRFRRHRAGMAGGIAILLVVCASFLAEFLSPHHFNTRYFEYVHLPPQRVHFFSDEGFHLRPFVYGIKHWQDPQTALTRYSEDSARRLPLMFFVRGDRYSFYGLFESNLHLVGTGKGNPFFLLGTDRFGRDLLSRLLTGGRISLTVGLLAVFLSLTLGTTMGMISGYYGGRIDHFVQRTVELISAFPSIPILMALSAVLPPQWPSYLTFMGIVAVLSLVGWGSLAREIRGKTLVAREADYVLAARSCGARDRRIIFRHLLPSMWSHVIVISTLAVPRFILSESTLSFLGLGIKAPLTSWGLLLADAMNLHVLVLYPWLLAPGACILITVLAFNYFGDGLRDAAAPFSGR
jgi:peptide/nickel transport system permease protein